MENLDGLDLEGLNLEGLDLDGLDLVAMMSDYIPEHMSRAPPRAQGSPDCIPKGSTRDTEINRIVPEDEEEHIPPKQKGEVWFRMMSLEGGIEWQSLCIMDSGNCISSPIEKNSYRFPTAKLSRRGLYAAVDRFVICAGDFQPDPEPDSQDGFDPLRSLCCLDTLSPHLGWKNVVMASGRSYPLMVAMNGKLYIFGSHIGVPCPGPWAEVFDPSTGQSVALRSHKFPDIEYRLHSIVALHLVEKIVLFSLGSGEMLSYDVKNQGWHLTNDPSLVFNIGNVSELCNTQPTVFGTTMYYFTPSLFVYAFDFNEHQWYSSGWLGEAFVEALEGFTGEINKEANEHAILWHIKDDHFCAVWDEVLPYPPKYIASWKKNWPKRPEYECCNVRIRLARLQISRNGSSLNVSVLSSFKLESPMSLMDALLVFKDGFCQ